MSLINKKIEPFTANAYRQGIFTQVTEQDFMGKWSVLLFYPADFTYVCPTELGEMAEQYENFQSIGCEVYSVSCDSHFVHKAWADASETIGKIRYPMIADPTGRLAREFDVMLEESGVALRGTFVLNPQGEVVCYEVHDLGIGRSAEELLRKVQAAQFVAEHGDQVCPAKWKPGSETIKPSLDLVGKL